MPRDDWAKARAKDKARQAGKSGGPWSISPGKRRQRKPRLKSWFQAIYGANTQAELSAVGRSLQVLHTAGKLNHELYGKLVEAGKQRRAQLTRHTAKR